MTYYRNNKFDLILIFDVRPWNLLAEKYDRKIVMTHHCNKQGESPKDSLLGSVGIGASFEDRLIIQRDGESATLYTDGKDIQEKIKILDSAVLRRAQFCSIPASSWVS